MILETIFKEFFEGGDIENIEIEESVMVKLKLLKKDYENEVSRPGCSGCIKRAAVKKFKSKIENLIKL